MTNDELVTVRKSDLRAALRVHQCGTADPHREPRPSECTCHWDDGTQRNWSEAFTAWIEHWIDSIPPATPEVADAAAAAVTRFLWWAYEREFSVHNWENGRQRTVPEILEYYTREHGLLATAAPQPQEVPE